MSQAQGGVAGDGESRSCQWPVVSCQKKQIPRGLKAARDDKLLGGVGRQAKARRFHPKNKRLTRR